MGKGNHATPSILYPSRFGNAKKKALREAVLRSRWLRNHADLRALVVLSFILVLYGGLILPTVRRQGISWDEQTDLDIARAYLASPVGWLTGSDSDPSQARLPMYLVALVYRLTGRDDLITARYFSVLTGALTILGVYVFCYRRFDTKRGLLAAGTLATSPFFLSFARTAFTETDIYLTCILAWWLVTLSKLEDQQTLGSVVPAGVLLGLAVSAKFTALFLFPAFGVGLLSWRKSETPNDQLGWKTLLVPGALGVIFFGFAGYRWGFLGFQPRGDPKSLQSAALVGLLLWAVLSLGPCGYPGAQTLDGYSEAWWS